MTIKTKLFCNALLTLAGIVIIGGVSLLGMKFVQGKLMVLTERCTPFQLKTIEMQRSLQEHTSNLLEVAFSVTAADLKNARSNAERTLAGVVKVSNGLETLKGQAGDSGGKEKIERLEKLTAEMFVTTEARLKAEEGARLADQAMRAKLQDATKKLSEVDDLFQKRQKNSSRQLSSSSGSSREITQKLMSLTSARDSLKDANFAFGEIQKATGKKGLIIARGRLDAAFNEFFKNRLVTTGDPSVKTPVELATAAKKLVVGPQGLLELKSAVLAKVGDPASASEYDQMSQNVGGKLSAAIIEIEQSVALATGKYNQENRNHDDSLKGSSAAGDALALNGDLISMGLDIKSTIRELFAARSTDEITQLANELKKRFGAIEGVQHRMAGTLAGSKSSVEASRLRSVGSTLQEIKILLLGKDGAVDKLQQVASVRGRAAALNLKLKELVAQQNDQGKRGVTAAQAEQETAVASVNGMVRTFVVAVSVIGLVMMVFGLATSLLLARSITNPVQELTVIAEGFGNGDFSRKMGAKGKDEFGRLAGHFNQATEKLGEITGALAQAIARLSHHSKELTATAEELSQGAHEQSLATEQSAAAMTEMSQTINEVSGSASQAADAAQQALKTANRGGEMVASTAQGMEKIAVSVRESASLVHNLGERSEQVGTIIDMINDIADQTRLLALNASIEAARAGEMGMGFAVVADEVRRLATRTTAATSEIAEMIKAIQEGTAQSVVAMKAGDGSVADGVKLASEASLSLAEIVEVSQRGAEMAERIAAAAEEQSTAAGQISANMEGMADITRRAEKSTQEIRLSSVELQNIADELSRMSSWFKV